MNSYTVKYSILSKHTAESQKHIYIPKTKSKKQANKKKLEKCPLKKTVSFFHIGILTAKKLFIKVPQI